MLHRVSKWRLSLRGWWAFLTEMQRDHIKVGATITVFLLVAGVGYYWSRPHLRRWERDQALEQAKDFAAQRDYRNALLALQRAMEKDANDVSGWTQVAEFLSELGSREVLVARRNLVTLAPDDLSLRLGFVLDALRFGDVDAARQAFSGVSEGAREEVSFFRMAAAIAYVAGKTAELEGSLEEIVRRAPTDHSAAMDLATLRLWGPDAARAQAAKQNLVVLLKQPDVRVRASVELLKHVAQTGTRDEARTLVAVLHARLIGRPAPQPTATGAEALTEPPGWTAVVEALKREGIRWAHDAAVVARWLSTIGQSREALVWLDTAEEKIRRSLVVSAAALELAVTINDVERLRPLLLQGAWGNGRADAIDLAFAARWQRQMARPLNAQATWSDAIAASADSLPALRVLTRLAMAWNDSEGARAAMLAIIDRFPSERWAWETLKLEYARKQETPKLWQLYDKWTRAQPDNRVVAQDWITLSVLTGQVTSGVHSRARELFQNTPTDVPSAIAYALSLRAQKRPADALAVLEKLSTADQAIPRVVLWRGVLQADTGQKSAARATLASVASAKLMPEEIYAMREASAAAAEIRALPAVKPKAPAVPPKP